MSKLRVHISGAGPVGLVTALGLCRAGIPVTIFEAGSTVCQDLRASYYHAPTVDMLEEIGYLEPLLEGGSKDPCFRFSDAGIGREVELDQTILGRRYRNPYAVSAGQNWFAEVGRKLLENEDCEILFNHRVTDARQDGDRVTVKVMSPDGEREFSTDWLLACDGGRGAVRPSLEIPYQGYTWPGRFLLIQTKYDFEPKFGRLNYRANGPDWRLVIKIPFGPGKDDWVYRIVSGIDPDVEEAAALDPVFCQNRLQEMAPASQDYEISSAVIYNVHQQVAETYRKGRVLLVGDAAHMNNPIGGQGLNCGVHDAFNLIEKFIKVWQGEAQPDLLDLYDRQRRKTNWDYVQKVSVENKARNEETDLGKRAAMMDFLDEVANDDDKRYDFLVLSRNGEPTLVPQFYTETEVIADEGVVEAIEENGPAKPKGSSLSQRLLDELAMQRRDILAIHLANDPALALDFMVFTLADADGHDWRAKKASTLVGSVASGPVTGFEAKDAPASAALAEFAGSLDESWRAGEIDVERFARFRALSDEARSAWLGHVVSRTLIASLACEGERSVPMHEVLGSLLQIEAAHWWRPTAANYFDRVAKARTLEALDAAGGPELVSRYAASKKAELASAAERIFSGNFIGEPEVKERAQAWLPAIMRFAGAEEVEPVAADADELASDGAPDEIAEQAA